MIPTGDEKYNADQRKVYYENGFIVIEYLVYVPDSTRSGDYRFEHVTARYPVVPA